MSNTQKIEELLTEIRQLEALVKEMQDAEIYPVSFFSRTFDLTHQILVDLHQLESMQIDSLKKQMEAHQARLLSIPVTAPHPLPTVEESLPVKDKTEQIEVMPEIITGSISAESFTGEEKEEEITETNIESPAIQQEETEQDVMEEEIEKKIPDISPRSHVCLSDALEKKNLTDFRKAFSLNDRFYFLRELFSGQENKMNEAISGLNELSSLEESLSYLTDTLNWELENEQVGRFIQLLEKRFL